MSYKKKFDSEKERGGKKSGEPPVGDIGLKKSKRRQRGPERVSKNSWERGGRGVGKKKRMRTKPKRGKPAKGCYRPIARNNQKRGDSNVIRRGER